MKELILTWQGFAFEGVSFLIFTYLLNIFLFKPVRRVLKQRKDALNSLSNKQKDYEKSSEEIIKTIEQERQKFRHSLSEVKESHYKEACAKSADIIKESKKEAVVKFNKFQQELIGSRSTLFDSIKTLSQELSILISQKILGD